MTPEQLRASILRYAFDGKLVEQNPKEEPSINMINDIRKEQERLIKLKEIKKEKIDTSITYEEELPEGWCVAKLGELTRVVTKQTGFDYSKTIKPNLLEYKAEGTIPLVQTKNFKGKEFSLDTDYYIPINIAKDFPKILLDGKCILLSIVGASIGNVGLYTLNDLGMIGGAICKVQLINDLLYDYLYYYLQSPLGQNEIKKNYKATAQGTITVQDVREIIIKIPPLEEQRRIVAKIEELLPCVDRYAEAYEKLEQFNAKFPEDMKKSILQYAIQGKLVEQRPEEGTAEELYQQIRDDKKRRLDGKKEAKLSSEVFTEDEIPYDIPDTWKWVRFGHIMIIRDAERIPLSVSERQKLQKIYDYYGASGVIDKVDRYLFDETLLLIGEDGANLLSRSTPVAFLAEGKYWVNNHAHVLDCNRELLDLEFIMYYINAITLAPYVTGTAQPKMNQEKMNSIPIALPPFEEQKRIVKKIKELLPYCDKLKR